MYSLVLEKQKLLGFFKANKEFIKFLSGYCDVSKDGIELSLGAKKRNKLIF
jgi:uncharacterized protein YggU (UPF0235/DUF167 family)